MSVDHLPAYRLGCDICRCQFEGLYASITQAKLEASADGWSTAGGVDTVVCPSCLTAPVDWGELNPEFLEDQ